MKGTIFAVALNHRSQLDVWQEAFQQSPYKAPPKTAVWFIKPRNTVIGCGEPIPFPQGEKVLSGATVALIVGKTATKVREEDAAEYIAGYALANDVSLPEESFYRPAIKAKCRDGFCPIGETVALSNVDNLTIYTEINGRPADHWNTADLQRNAAQRIRHAEPRRRHFAWHTTNPRGHSTRRSRSCSRRRFPAAGKSGSGRT